MTSAVLNRAESYSYPARAAVGWRFWLPALFVVLAIVVPNFQLVNVLQAGGAILESEVTAGMAAEYSFRESLYTLSLLGLGGVGCLLLLWAEPTAQRTSLPLWLMLGMLALTIASLVWSSDPAISFRRTAVTALYVIGCWGIGKTWRPMHLVQLVFWLSAATAVAGIAAEMLYGTLLTPSNYRFSGFLHPNQQALSCGMWVLAAAALQTSTGNKLYWAAGLLAFTLLLATGSRGGLVACTAAAVFYVVLITPPARRIGWFLLGGLCLGLGLLYLALEPGGGRRLEALATLGRDDPQADPKSLTGRLPIWDQIIADINERPILGYGYAAYWTPERVHRMSYIHDWEFNNAHSSYLEVMLSVGWVGFGLGLLAMTAVFIRGWRIYAAVADCGLLFILAVFVMAWVSGLIESSFVSPGYEFIVWLTGAFIIVYYPVRLLASDRLRQPA